MYMPVHLGPFSLIDVIFFHYHFYINSFTSLVLELVDVPVASIDELLGLLWK